jgi:hypothetical protein
MITAAAPFTALAEIAPPAAFGAPEHFGAGHYYVDSVYYTLSVPEDMRNYIERRAADDPDKQTYSPYIQIDYKIDGGSWHHTSEWDSPKTAPSGISNRYLNFHSGKKYISSDRWTMRELFPEDATLELFNKTGWDYLKNHAITYRARFAQSFDGETYVLSPWSKEYTLSAKAKADYNKLINHAPSLVSAEVKKRGDEPCFEVKTGRLPGEVQDLNAMASNSMRIEVWARKAGETDFKRLEADEWFMEAFDIEASDFFGSGKESYDAMGYEIKTRYALDLREYKQTGHFQTSTTSVMLYGPFSNVISHNMPAWSNASTWASAELKKADDAGLIPDILKGADLTKPITREEFAELAVLLYEKTTGQKAAAASPNPFKDTTNPQILKAFKLGITTGTTATTFAPKELINREQVATMLSRALRVMAPGADFSTAGAPALTDRKDISAYAVDHVLFMAKLEIIKGVDGKFMPKATTTAQKASGYATATREQSILMSVRSYEKMDTIKSSKGTTTPATQPSQAAQKPTTPASPAEQKPAATQPAKPEAGSGSIAGTWQNGSMTGHNFDAVTGTFRYNFGVGLRYTFNGNGTFSSSFVSGYGSMVAITGKYSVKGDKITFSGQTSKGSSDYGKTWKSGNSPADETRYYALETDDKGSYLLIGLEDATPPLDTEINAVSYSFMP